MAGNGPQGSRRQRQGHSPGMDVEQLVAGFRAWVLNGPDQSTLTFSKAGGSVTLNASAVHGSALELLQRFSPQK